ncbi:hypothetical protein HMPREF9970_0379 [Lachnoanaerobaculum saburreum F0468]|uniref:Uncharacterized protein n=1 Tax=Lachnoanaerobaculum saburreum F0468 TaxID=1095750 RepID=I0R7J7_9FIRM|nr:hypothetical protein HMPREF9970_0379 [Lachnoanaerobaculum saburreum F0468]
MSSIYFHFFKEKFNSKKLAFRLLLIKNVDSKAAHKSNYTTQP